MTYKAQNSIIKTVKEDKHTAPRAGRIRRGEMKNTEAGKATRRVQLKNMPFDRFEDGIGYIHATGYDCLVDGQWMTEYEDNIFEDAAGYSYEVEPEEEPEWTEEDEAQWAETFKPYPGFEE